MRFLIVVIGVAFGVSTHLWADDAPTRISIGGPRQVSADISRKDETLLVAVKMIPVRSFDVGKNRLINRAKAEAYAKLVLAKYLRGDDDAVVLSLSGKEVLEAREIDKKFCLTMRLPLKGIKIDKSTFEKVPPNFGVVVELVNDPRQLNVLTVKADYLATVEALGHALGQDIPPEPIKSGNSDAFFEAIAQCEEEGTAAFAAIRSEMQADKLLLSVEKDEIDLRIDESEKTFLETLRKKVRQWNKASTKGGKGA